ncbi:hypothetical protein EGY16_37495 [Burkholderia pseudomallei]|uniref:Uncharacterized protein n=1 Tax=Burkholderia pseudomallei (strain 1106a) TaxID=357348 RepID=A3P8W6_BURP0|nr:hypothetical protein BURPS1106A_A2746 [Burkholderia pseudomallei 1106a]AFR20634.1 hypothetical protein BPC006_II2709 [Burkholderia pseudomallei BPC006]ARK45477.1 hypothetical protein BOC35_03125 [Burkholderia pseudomallei]EES23620.1 hypothetical protein BURPS1106B_2428 [Burkholderia pseudomallei 1106b]ARK70299.1 hypothetical protein BOC38_27180 [Burkholderia pseudomallei]
MSRISPVAPRRLPRRPAERAPRRRFPVSSCWPFLWCADVVSRRNGSALVQSKGRAIARKRPRDKASATKAGNRGRLTRGVLIHRRINPGKAVARAATGCVCDGVRVYAHVARVRCHAGERAGEQATAARAARRAWRRRRRDARAARRRRKRLIVAGVRRPVRAAAIAESMLSPGRVSESIRFAKAGAAGRLRPIAVGKSLTQSAAPRTARTRHASRACARSMRAQGFRAGVPAAGRAARRHRAAPAPQAAPQAARPCRAARDAGRRARAP